MAHELATNVKTGKASMAWVRADGTPWHGLGVGVEEAMTAEQALTLSGQDYEVAKVQLFAPLPNGEPIAIPGKFATVRTDTGDLMGLVTDKYKVVQNAECYQFMDELVGAGELRYHTAGALKKGQIIWMLAKLRGNVRVVGDDVLDKYLLLSSTHDGTQGLRALFTPIRVVCWNTLSMALRQGVKTGFTFTHHGNLASQVNEARAMLGLANTFFDAFGRDSAELTRFAISDEQAAAYFARVYADPSLDDLTGVELDRAEREVEHNRAHRGRLLELFHTGVGVDMPGVKGTAWAAYNAVTEHVDHDRPDRKGQRDTRSQSQLWDSMLTGGRSLKGRAFGAALDMARREWIPSAPVTVPVAAPAKPKAAKPKAAKPKAAKV